MPFSSTRPRGDRSAAPGASAAPRPRRSVSSPPVPCRRRRGALPASCPARSGGHARGYRSSGSWHPPNGGTGRRRAARIGFRPPSRRCRDRAARSRSAPGGPRAPRKLQHLAQPVGRLVHGKAGLVGRDLEQDRGPARGNRPSGSSCGPAAPSPRSCGSRRGAGPSRLPRRRPPPGRRRDGPSPRPGRGFRKPPTARMSTMPPTVTPSTWKRVVEPSDRSPEAEDVGQHRAGRRLLLQKQAHRMEAADRDLLGHAAARPAGFKLGPGTATSARCMPSGPGRSAPSRRSA